MYDMNFPHTVPPGVEAGMVQIKVNGNWDLIMPVHRAVRPNWHDETGWERERLDAMYRNIKPGDVVYDVGAEEGDFPALFASWGAQVVLIEPNPKVWPNTRATFEANGLRPLGWFVGFCSNATELNPYRNDVNATDVNGWPECSYGERIPDHGFRHLAQQTDHTPQIRLDELVRDTGHLPDVITMDVEGAEFEVLKGAHDTLRDAKPMVFISLHREFMADMYPEDTPEGLFAYMTELGYKSKHLATDHEEHHVFWHQDEEEFVE